ncbi:MAG: PH domain-containing protein [Chloroflexi bacterium]|jgi:hypothetical protein|nr:PH domain-containing protein [Chloroflexota bacterium]
MEPKEYRPAIASRKAELAAWALALVTCGAWAYVSLTGQFVHRAMPFVSVLLLIFAVGNSLANWMDRRTRIRLDDQGVEFENGLRHTVLKWDEIQQVQVFPSSWGKKVRVIGPQKLFMFRTMGKVKVQGEEVGRLGFPQGDEILRLLIENANLKKETSSQQPAGAVYYYAARE